MAVVLDIPSVYSTAAPPPLPPGGATAIVSLSATEGQVTGVQNITHPAGKHIQVKALLS